MLPNVPLNNVNPIAVNGAGVRDTTSLPPGFPQPPLRQAAAPCAPQPLIHQEQKANASAGSHYQGPSTTKKPRPEVIRDFLNYWFEFAEGTVEIAWRDAETGELNKTAHFDVRDHRIEEHVANLNSVGGQDCYFTASIVNKTSGYATDKDVVCSPGFWVDQDKLEDIEYADSVQHDFTPTALVHTGTVPEKRRQMWFRLEQPTQDMKLLRDMNERLHGLYHGDASVKNPSRWMRLPGTIAWAWKPGRAPEHVTWERAASGRLSHPIDLAATLPIPEPTFDVATGKSSNFKSVDYYIDNILADNGSWHNSVRDLVSHWIMKGRSNREMLLYAPSFTRPGYTVEQTEEEILKCIDSFRQKYDASYREEIISAPGAGFVANPLTPADLRPVDDWVPIGRRARDIPPDTTPHLVRDVIKTGMTGVIHAPHFTGKTVLIADLACSIANGIPWMGHRCRQGSVYIAELEGETLLADNVRAWHHRGGLEVSPNIIIAGEFFQLLENASMKRLKRDLIYYHQQLEGGITFVAFDTYSQLIAGEDENATPIGAVAAKTIALLCREIGATGITAHHSNANGESRGAKSFTSNQDFEMALSKQAGSDTVQIEYKKLKGSPLAPPDYFKIMRVDFPGLFDEDGKQLNAGVTIQVPPADARVKAAKAKIKPKSPRDITYRAISENSVSGRISRENALDTFNHEYVTTKPGSTMKTRRDIFNREVRKLMELQLIEAGTDGQLRVVSKDQIAIFPPTHPSEGLIQ